MAPVVGGSSPLAHPKLKTGRAPVAQRTERRTSDPLVAGSNPAGRASQYNRIADFRGPLAQLAEHLTLNQGVTGSIPVRSTILFFGESGGTGRHAGLRIQWRKPCGFKSRLSHQGRSHPGSGLQPARRGVVDDENPPISRGIRGVLSLCASTLAPCDILFKLES